MKKLGTYAVALDATVELLRQISYQNGIKDAAKVCDNHAFMRCYNQDERNVARSCAEKIRAFLKEHSQESVEGCKKAATGRGAP